MTEMCGVPKYTGKYFMVNWFCIISKYFSNIKGQYNAPTWCNSSTTQAVALPHEDISLNCTVEFSNHSIASTATGKWEKWPQRKTTPPNTTFSGGYFTIMIFLSNVTEVDHGYYMLYIIYSGNCLFSCANISLVIADECYGVMPEPMTKEKVTVTVSPGTLSLTLVANFSGDTIETHYRILWSNSSTHDLLLVRPEGKYFPKHRRISDCAFIEELEIRNISEMDGGLYTASALGYGRTGNVTVFEVIIENSHEDTLIVTTSATASLFYILIIIIVPILSLVVCISAILIYKKRKKNSPRRCKY